MSLIIYSETAGRYSSPGHPESPERVIAAHKFLKQQGFDFISPGQASEEEILSVHTRQLFEKVKGEDYVDPETPALEGIFGYVMTAAGAAVDAYRRSCQEGPVFSLLRPPGHHATRRALGGFCYFNNIAVAVRRALSDGRKVAIVDIDCHHGNGTEDIFMGQENVMFASLHQSPLYPGTGLRSEMNCFNFPLPSGTSEEGYLAALDGALEKAAAFCPDVLAVSAGFDTYREDPLTDMCLDQGSYFKIAEKISSVCRNRFALLEGGYSPDLPKCIYQFLKGFFI